MLTSDSWKAPSVHKSYRPPVKQLNATSHSLELRRPRREADHFNQSSASSNLMWFVSRQCCYLRPCGSTCCWHLSCVNYSCTYSKNVGILYCTMFSRFICICPLLELFISDDVNISNCRLTVSGNVSISGDMNISDCASTSAYQYLRRYKYLGRCQ
jgi:hypothetical protein